MIRPFMVSNFFPSIRFIRMRVNGSDIPEGWVKVSKAQIVPVL